MTSAWAQRQEELLSDCIVSPDVFNPMVDRLAEFVVPYQQALETETGQRNLHLYLQGLLFHEAMGVTKGADTIGLNAMDCADIYRPSMMALRFLLYSSSDINPFFLKSSSCSRRASIELFPLEIFWIDLRAVKKFGSSSALSIV